ncbi:MULTISPECIES: hypothetical protein [unclassified Crossiella]|uniref:hypothetical protein n=1 Tax=unclassified Crossiella TaxID=2620835 RepID=UPI001FFF9C69|nr:MULTISPECIES: hypothetical protein [unclassified Crossiella]MCK2240401.1 hypothetical protein [Crossiella sp. S99.2]MCK2253147.1 hypothetical protein [Crossiella sp. S99.1]
MDDLISVPGRPARAWAWSVVVLGVLLAIAASLTGPLAAALAGGTSGVAAALFGSAALLDPIRGHWQTVLGATLLATGTAACVLLRT